MQEKLIAHVEQSYNDAQLNKSKIANDWRVMDQYSMSSKRFKLLLNNLCSLENSTYLEVGCFRGGTVAAAAYDNKLRAVYAIDNFCYDPLGIYKEEDGSISNKNPNGWPNVKSGFINHIDRLGLSKVIRLHAGDWEKTPENWIKHKINILHVDVNEQVDQVLKFFDKYLDKQFILVVTGYNSTEVIKQVDSWLSDTEYTTEHKIVKFSSSTADSEGWWNGLGLFLINKGEK